MEYSPQNVSLTCLMVSAYADVVPPGNRTQLESLLASMQQLAEDVNDPISQKAAFQFLGRCITTWLEPVAGANGQANGQSQALPGFERFVYERLIPSAFSVLSSPQFNIKDGQMLVVSS